MSMRRTWAIIAFVLIIGFARSEAHDAGALASPTGFWNATLVSPHHPAPGLFVMTLPGRVPGMLLEYSGSEEVVVLGRSGQPFLRFRADGVDANVRSTLWIENARARGEPVEEAADAQSRPEWRRVSRVPRFAWIEFRAWPGSDGPAGGGVERP